MGLSTQVELVDSEAELVVSLEQLGGVEVQLGVVLAELGDALVELDGVLAELSDRPFPEDNHKCLDFRSTTQFGETGGVGQELNKDRWELRLDISAKIQ